MSKPFDATLNDLVDLRPTDWANCFARLSGIPHGPSTVLDTDLATTLQADKVFRIDGERPSLLHLEFEANPRLGIPHELMRYNTLVDHQHGLPVETTLILLRPKAFASDQTGHFVRRGVAGNVIAEFRFRMEKVWERPIDFWLESGPGLAPLSMVTDEANADLEAAIERFESFLQRTRVEERVAQGLVGSTYVLCGLRYHQERIEELFRRLAMLMEDSTTYQFILQKGMRQGVTQGQLQGQKTLLLRQGTKRFGPPTEANAAALQAIDDPERLERLADKILEARGWDELLSS
jgi:hypothetical protein